MGKTIPTKVRRNRRKTIKTEGQEEINTASTPEIDSQTSGDSTPNATQAADASGEGAEVNLVETPRKRKTRTPKAQPQTKVSKDVADMVMGLIEIVGSSVSDEGALTDIEKYLIVTGITNMPASENVDRLLEKIYPIAGGVGLLSWALRTFTHRRKPPMKEVPQPVYDNTISQPTTPTLYPNQIPFDFGANGHGS